MQKSNDEQFVGQYLEGDEKSLEILIKQYLKPIYSFVYRYVGSAADAEDITQEVFVRMWRNLKKFDRQKKFKTWLFSIAKNTSIDWLRKKKSIPFSKFDNENGQNTIAERIAEPSAPFWLSVDNKNTLNFALEQLSPKYRAIISYRYNDFTFREIAQVLGKSINTVKSQYRRALKILKKIIGH